MSKTIRIAVLLASLMAANAGAQFKSERQFIFNASDLIRKPTGLFDKLLR
jgi:hypothetical protein